MFNVSDKRQSKAFREYRMATGNSMTRTSSSARVENLVKIQE
jgi:hypothetical protein